ncbi:Eco57I restriction-modification methylase domain-containing protein [Myxococcota bacterium]|nr:Eco57I restriction-modification methylase domain-containing protein [Myxococcota bacterium]
MATMPKPQTEQLHFFRVSKDEAAAKADGEVFTQPWVVELILDLTGYAATSDLAASVAVEPSCGQGAFFLPMLDRLIESCRTHGKDIRSATHALRATDLQPGNVEVTRRLALARLVQCGVDPDTARSLVESWIRVGDYLLDPGTPSGADFVIGNPPYVRLENIPDARCDAYRAACLTMRGRSDLFVGFIERGLRDLKPDGTLGFIVADRWMRNQYGADLRRFVGGSFSVEVVVEMHDVAAFEDDVAAYPAVVVIRRRAQGQARVARSTSAFGPDSARRLVRWHANPAASGLTADGIEGAVLDGWFRADEPWPTGTIEQLAVIAELESKLPAMGTAESSTRVGIGVATGADDLYLTRNPNQVEADRLLPVVMASDVRTGSLQWSGHYLVNPWKDGRLVDLSDYPKLAAYFDANADRIRRRHTAVKNPARWFRTIDRVDPTLQQRSKLLFPEMKATAHPVLDEGGYYPHHNLYAVTSDVWDLETLGGLLLSDLANLFIGAYCVRMRGGTMRFQAQYLRRIRLPLPDAVTTTQARELGRAFRQRDVGLATAVVAEVLKIDFARLIGVTQRRAA